MFNVEKETVDCFHFNTLSDRSPESVNNIKWMCTNTVKHIKQSLCSKGCHDDKHLLIR